MLAKRDLLQRQERSLTRRHGDRTDGSRSTPPTEMANTDEGAKWTSTSPPTGTDQATTGTSATESTEPSDTTSSYPDGITSVIGGTITPTSPAPSTSLAPSISPASLTPPASSISPATPAPSTPSTSPAPPGPSDTSTMSSGSPTLALAPSTTSTSSSGPLEATSADRRTLAAGAIAGITISALLIVTIALLAAFLLMRRRRRLRMPPSKEFMIAQAAGMRNGDATFDFVNPEGRSAEATPMMRGFPNFETSKFPYG